VPYSAIGTMSANVIGRQLPAFIDAISNVIELHRGGRLRILATSGTTRSPLLPGVPTIREQGLPTIEGHTWFGLFAPAKTPRTTIDRLSAAAGEAVRSAEVVSRLLPLGLEPTGTTPNELAAIMATDAAHWIPIVKASGFVAE
jgi:tripartite-type tricarboxylate transporter receptor subunit TctC